MNRLDQKLEQLKLENRSGLVCYFTAGDPNFTESCRLLSQLGQAGADIIEVRYSPKTNHELIKLR